MPHRVTGSMLLLILNWNALFGSIFSLEAIPLLKQILV